MATTDPETGAVTLTSDEWNEIAERVAAIADKLAAIRQDVRDLVAETKAAVPVT